MATDIVDDGSANNDGNGDTLRAAFTAINLVLQKADATSEGEVRLFEDADNGTNYVALKSTAAVTANRAFILPDADVTVSTDITDKTALITAAVAGTGTLIDLFEPTGGGTSKTTLTPVALTANRAVTMTDAAVDLADVNTNATHTAGDGSDHADVATNSVHVAGDGSDHADVATNSAFVTALGSVANGAGASTVAIEDAGTLFTATDVEAALAEAATDIVALQGQTTALIAENTDGQMFISAAEMQVISGTWALTSGAAGMVQTRTAAAASHEVLFPISLPSRSTASKGRKLTGFDFVYSINTEDADDVVPVLIASTFNGDGSIPTIASPAVSYDAAHDSAAERGDSTGAPEQHTCVVTVDTPAYIADDVGYQILVTCDDTTGGGAVIAIYGVTLKFSETLVDGS
jgi:hypothetical protein